MESPITSTHFNDTSGNPAGGFTRGTGFAIAWQEGPLGACDCPGGKSTTEYPEMLLSGHADWCARDRPNGAFVEDITKAAIDRIEYYQSSRFACKENAEALNHLRAAIYAMNRRTSRRVAAGVEGTHTED